VSALGCYVMIVRPLNASHLAELTNERRMARAVARVSLICIDDFCHRVSDILGVALSTYLLMSLQGVLDDLAQLYIRLMRMLAVKCSRCKAFSYIVSRGDFSALGML